jgi:hypothetical protein
MHERLKRHALIWEWRLRFHTSYTSLVYMLRTAMVITPTKRPQRPFTVMDKVPDLGGEDQSIDRLALKLPGDLVQTEV